MSDSNVEIDAKVKEINEGKLDFSADEQDIIDSWLEKLSEPQDTEEKEAIRNKYVSALARLVTEEKQLLAPFTEKPPVGDLISLSRFGQKKFDLQMKRLTQCKRKTTRSTPKGQRVVRSLSPVDSYNTNNFEDPEEMAKAIARSKGQSFAEFVVSISRHTADFGQELRRAMKVETSTFREFVDNVLTQRIKDLTEILDEEQNRELQKIKESIDKWQTELALVKRRIEEMIPDFDLDKYKQDPHYLRKLFTVKTGMSEDDSFKKWKEESFHRLKWISDRTCKITRCNEKTKQEISNTKCETANLEAREAMNQQSYINQINCAISEYQNLQTERDKLQRENNDLLSQLEEMEN